MSHGDRALVEMGMDNEGAPFATMVGTLLDSLDAAEGDAVVVRWTDGRSVAVEEPAWDHSLERMLVQSACAGDDDALDILLRHEWYGVYRLVSQIERDCGRAEELVQEVFARAIANLGEFRGLGIPFRSYVAQIARRLMRDVGHPGAPQNVPGGVPGAFDAPEPPDLIVYPAQDDRLAPSFEKEPAVVVLSADLRPRFLAALDRLPRQSRELLWLRLVEGRTEVEIGIECGRPPASVRDLQRRALAALRAVLDDPPRPAGGDGR